MAKKNQVYIDIVIDDKGTTKRVAVDAKKLGVELDRSAAASERGAKNTDKLSKSTKDLDRNMRGTAKMSTNQTKEFSKMQQGMGGLVGAYATLAAQVFAVSAAFQFLQGASNMRNLINGQEALGAMTGTAYKTITNSIIEATDAQIKYADAAKAAAIGSAAGLTSGQLTRLGEVAKNASFALGRDLTDSFNRLVRGVTKAEPELLDELGIILRLDTATRKYAESVGSSVGSLTAFQRSQAVANEVLEQGEKKFAAINHMMSADAANLAQFTKSFDDLFNTIKITVIKGLNPVLKFLSSNTLGLVAALGLFAIPIVKSILPNLHDWRKTQGKIFEEHKENSATYKQNIMDQSSAIKQLAGDQVELGKEAAKAAERTGKDTTKGGVGYVTGGTDNAQARNAAKKGLKQAENDLKKHGVVMNGIFRGYTAKEVAIARASYNERSGIAKTHTNFVVTQYKTMAARIGIVNNSIRIGWAKTMMFMTSAATVASRGINLIMSAMGIIGILSMIVAAAISAVKYFKPMSDEAKKTAEDIENLTNKYKDLGLEMQRSREAREMYATGSDAAVNIGNMMQSADVKNIIADLNLMAGMTDKTSDEFLELKAKLEPVTKELGKVDKGFIGLADSLENGERVSKIQRKAMTALADTYAEIGQTIKNLPDKINKANQAFTKLSSSMIASNPIDAFLADERQVLDGLTMKRDAATQQATAREADLEAQKATIKTQKQLDDEMFAQFKGFEGEKERMIARFEKKNAKEKAAFRAGEFGSGNLTVNTANPMYGVTRDYGAQFKERVRIQQAQGEDRKEADAINKKLDYRQDRFNQLLELRNEQVSAARENLKADTEATNNTVVAVTLAGKLNNLVQQELKTKKGVVKAENDLAIALKHQSTMKSEEDGSTPAEVRAAQEAVDFAKQNVKAQKALAALATKKNAAKQQQVRLEMQLLTLQIAQMDLALKGKGTRLAIAGETALGGGTLESKREIRKLQGEQLADKIQAETIKAEQAAITYNKVYAEKLKQNYEQAVLKNEGPLSASQMEGVVAQSIGETRTATGDGLNNANADLDRAKQAQTIHNSLAQTFVNQTTAKRQQAAIDLEALGYGREHAGVMAEVLEMKRLGIPVTEQQIELLKREATETSRLKRMSDNLVTIREGLTDGFAGAFESIITGAKSAKEAFQDMGKSMLAMLAKIIAQELALAAVKAIGSTFGIGFLMADGGITPEFAKGGYTSPKRNYGRGGMARGPQSGYNAVLHGNEAVVPLPDNRNIPVELSGNTGGQNNVTVNVSMDSSGNTSQNSQQDSAQMGKLGGMIASAVQQELQFQKRSGGILNPYGVA